jgi:hypothetical protein
MRTGQIPSSLKEFLIHAAAAGALKEACAELRKEKRLLRDVPHHTANSVISVNGTATRPR